MGQQLAAQQQRAAEAGQTLMRESVDAYMDFLTRRSLSGRAAWSRLGGKLRAGYYFESLPGRGPSFTASALSLPMARYLFDA